MPHRVLHRSISILVSLPGDDQIDYRGRRLTLTVLRVSAREDCATWQVRGTVGNGSGPVVLYRRDPVIPDNVRQRLDALADSVIPAGFAKIGDHRVVRDISELTGPTGDVTAHDIEELRDAIQHDA